MSTTVKHQMQINQTFFFHYVRLACLPQHSPKMFKNSNFYSCMTICLIYVFLSDLRFFPAVLCGQFFGVKIYQNICGYEKKT